MPLPPKHLDGSGTGGLSRRTDSEWLTVLPMRYPVSYLWFVLVSTLDVVLTWIVLFFNGSELNPVARLVIDRWDLPGAIGFKFSLMLFVILTCEFVGRQKDRTGRWLARVAVIISLIPVIYTTALLAYHLGRHGRPLVIG